MGAVIFECGCHIEQDVVTGQILKVKMCEEHAHMYSENKTNKQMAQEISDLVLWECKNGRR
jgi:hypothetical protein